MGEGGINGGHLELRDDRRPKKSVRKGLWKMAKRMAALATWSIMTVSTYASNTTPQPVGSQAISLLEIGDHEMTLEVAQLNYNFSEPLYQEEIEGENGRNMAIETIKELRPATFWIHGDKIGNAEELVEEVLMEQMRTGRRIVIQAAEESKFWKVRCAKALTTHPGFTS